MAAEPSNSSGLLGFTLNSSQYNLFIRIPVYKKFSQDYLSQYNFKKETLAQGSRLAFFTPCAMAHWWTWVVHRCTTVIKLMGDVRAPLATWHDLFSCQKQFWYLESVLSEQKGWKLLVQTNNNSAFHRPSKKILQLFIFHLTTIRNTVCRFLFIQRIPEPEMLCPSSGSIVHCGVGGNSLWSGKYRD